MPSPEEMAAFLKKQAAANTAPAPAISNGTPTPPAGEGDDSFVPLPLPSEVEAQNSPDLSQDPMQALPGSAEHKKALAAGQITDTRGSAGAVGGNEAAGNPLVDAGAALEDVGQGALGGIEKGAKETAKSVVSGVNTILPSIATGGGTEGKRVISKAIDSIPQVPAPETPAGQLASSAGQFSVAMVGIGKVTKAVGFLQGMGKLVTGARVALEGGAAQATAFDPHDQRMSNMIVALSEEHPSLANPISEYLAAKPDDTEAEGRFKNFLEGSMMTGAAESLLASVRGLKKIQLAKAAGGDEAAARATAEVADELETLQVQPGKGTDTVTGEGEAIPPKPSDAGVEPAPAPEPKTPDAIAQEDADSIIKEMTGQAEFPVDRMTGLLNHEKIDTTGTARQVLELTAEKLAPQIESKVGGVQTWKETSDLADILGVPSDELWTNLSALSTDAHKQAGMVLAARRQMNGIAKAISNEARSLDNGLKTDRAPINAMIQRLADMEKVLLPIRTAQARGTRQWGIVADDVMSAQQIKALVASGGDLSAVMNVAGPVKSLFAKLVGAHNQLWLNAILGSVKTNIVNATTNLCETVLRPAEKIIGGNAEGFSQYMGLAQSVKDSVKLMAKSFKLEESIADPHLSKFEGQPQALSPQAFGFKSEGFSQTPVATFLDYAAKTCRLPQRFLTSGDELFKQLNGRAVAYAKASREAVQNGLDGAERANYIENRFNEMISTDGAITDPSVLQEARLATFTQPLDPKGIVGGLDRFVKQHPLLTLVTPFIKISNNLLQTTVHRTPLVNLAFKSYRAELAAGGGRAAAARGKMVTGGLMWAYAVHKVLDGTISGKGPADPARRKAMSDLTGWKPYSLKIGDNWVPYNRLDPYTTVLGLAADFTEAHGYLQGDEHEKLAGALGLALAQNLTSKTYLRGLSDMLEAIDQPDRKAMFALRSRLGSYIPAVLQQGAGLVGGGDDTMREVRSSLDAILNRTPGYSETLPPRRNAIGEPLHFPPGLGPDSVSPFVYSKDISDPTRSELARFNFQPPAQKINGGRIDLTKYTDPKGNTAYDRLGELTLNNRKGRYTFKERLDNEVNSSGYQSLPQGDETYSSERFDRLKGIKGEYLEHNMRKLREEFPSLDKDIRTDEHNQGAAKKQGPSGLQALLGN